MAINLPPPFTGVDCILVNKVFDSCFQKECFMGLAFELPECGRPWEFVSISFNNGEILPGYTITPPTPPAVESIINLTVRIGFTLTLRDEHGTLHTIKCHLPDIPKSVALYYPEARSEMQSELRLRVETMSELLTVPPVIRDNRLILNVGVTILIKVIGKVQLYVAVIGDYCVPRECAELPEEDVCEQFLEAGFPEDFYPEQLPIFIPNNGG